MGSVPDMIIKVAGESLREPRLVLLGQCLKCEPLHHALLLWRPAQICCCVAGSALPPDDEVPCMVNMCFVNCFPRLGICVSLGDMTLGWRFSNVLVRFLPAVFCSAKHPKMIRVLATIDSCWAWAMRRLDFSTSCGQSRCRKKGSTQFYSEGSSYS